MIVNLAFTKVPDTISRLLCFLCFLQMWDSITRPHKLSSFGNDFSGIHFEIRDIYLFQRYKAL